MALAPVAYILWAAFSPVHPQDPVWAKSGPLHPLQRPRLHVALFLAALDWGPAVNKSNEALGETAVTLGRHQNFRQLGSPAPASGIIAVDGSGNHTGPLGQGVANSVGMAMAALDGQPFSTALDLRT